ncbi:MAG: UDP-N-acetylmuramoyl-L-alanine--D-glutamate ligase, partial [bacterium]|nr:UDP-N-acetylmuramoyl-L-alanine--D-glutamate ligase [bacterium]
MIKKRIHFMGMRGSGMAGVASLASKMGYRVTGCDLETGGHDAKHLKNTDLLVVTPAVYFQKVKDPELIEGEKRGIALTWQEFLGKILLKDKKVIAVAGTHGKSTTTAMIAKLLIDNGFDPIAVVGARVPEWGGNSRFGKGEYAVVEADEFNDNFLNYSPVIEVINNIEFDHPDYFKSEKQMLDSYKNFSGNLTGKKILITQKDSLGKKFNLKVLGEHNQKNANMAYVLGKKLDIKEEIIIKSLESFEGIERRMELILNEKGIRVYDDYAHHPTAITATLAALREKYQNKHIWAIVEPHGYERTHALLPLYKNVFRDADKVTIGPIFKARDSETFGMTPEKIVKISKHPNIQAMHDISEIIGNWKLEIGNYDVVVVMGAGKSNLWAREIAGIIQNENILLKDITTSGIGGPAKLFKEVKQEKELIEIIKKAKKDNLEYLIIGFGSNLLISDSGFDGLVIKNSIDEIEVEDSKIIVKSGTPLSVLVETTVKKGLSGMERMVGIPGTVGGAIYGNAGAYGQVISDYLVRVKVSDGKKTHWLSKEECCFNYRESIFKKTNNIILEVEFEMPEGKPDSLRKESQKILKERLKRYPAGVKCPGSFFKNLEVGKLTSKQLKKIPMGKINFGKISAGYLLEAVGAKGMNLGNIKVTDYHANLIINTGGGTASDFYQLIQKLKEKVKDKFGIELESEVQMIGFKKGVAVLGYGLEGQDAEKYFKGLGENITILDKKFDEKYLSNLNSFDIIVRSPGVYRYLPEIVEAEKKGVEITSAIKLFFEKCPAKIIGVTGTKGKGTTSTLIYQILKKAGKDVYLAGNIGKPYLELLPVISNKSYVVLEMSSFQLIDMTKSPDIAVVLNITSDHMDWHKSVNEYVDAKKNIVRYQSASDWSVINSEYKISNSFSKLTKAKVILFSKKTLDKEYKEKLFLRGEHNFENIAAAVEVANILEIKDPIILEVVRSFKGLEHRLEPVKTINGIAFYNDSFATGPQPTIAAIKSFTEPLTVILGGSEKGLDYEELGREITKARNIKTVIVIGNVGHKIISALKKAKYRGAI